LVFGLVVFEILDGAFVFFGGGAGVEGAEIALASGARIFLAGVKAEFSAGKFSYHNEEFFSLENASGVFRGFMRDGK
jgi:hypothetical protein